MIQHNYLKKRDKNLAQNILEVIKWRRHKNDKKQFYELIWHFEILDNSILQFELKIFEENINITKAWTELWEQKLGVEQKGILDCDINRLEFPTKKC